MTKTLWLCVIAATALAASAALLAVERSRHNATRETLLTERAQYAERLAQAYALAAKQESLYRKLEQEMPHAVEKLVQERYAPKLAQLSTDLSRANAAAGRLRQSTAALAERARQACANPTADGGGGATSDPVGVLAHVLGRADERAGELAQIADRRLIGWDLCVAQYNTVRDRFNQTGSQLDQLVSE